MLLVVIGVLQSVAIAVIYTHCVELKGDGAAMLPLLISDHVARQRIVPQSQHLVSTATAECCIVRKDLKPLTDVGCGGCLGVLHVRQTAGGGVEAARP